MTPIYVEGVSLGCNDDSKLKIVIESTKEKIYIPIDKEYSMYIAEVIANIDDYSDIYKLFSKVLGFTRLKIDKVLIYSKSENSHSVIYMKDSENHIYENIVNIETGIIIGLKSKSPIFMKDEKDSNDNHEFIDIKPQDFYL
jgi:hypothetical protein